VWVSPDHIRVNFKLPEGTYKFRGDYQGSQYWATEPVIAHQVNIERPLIFTGLLSRKIERSKTDNIDKRFYIPLTPISNRFNSKKCSLLYANLCWLLSLF